MPDAVFVEIERVRQHGYNFPEKIKTSRIKLTHLKDSEADIFRRPGIERRIY